MKRPRQKTKLELDAEVADWNARYPVGNEVLYHPVINDPAYRRRRTTSTAFVLSGHTACIFLEGESGCVAIDACEPVLI